MRINIGPIQMRRRVKIGPLKIGVKKIYPELEDLEVTPTTEEQIFKSEKYGYNEVKVKGTEGLVEDLNVELTEQDNLLNTQEIIIKQIIEALKNKFGDNNDFTISEIEKLLVSYFETKKVEEVEG